MYWALALVVAAFLGLIPANIAKNKGYNFGTWWVYGWLLFIVAIIHVQFIPNKNAAYNHSPSVPYMPINEKVESLFTMSERQYIPGSPVLVIERDLLKGDFTKSVVARIKIQSISEKPIKAATVRISTFDTAGRPIGSPIEHHYLDFTVGRDSTFGENESISLPDPTTRSYSVSVTEVIFSDNSIWNAPDEPWEVLQAPPELSAEISDRELLKQYRLTYGEDSNYSYTEVMDLWYCVCGAINREGEEHCHRCGKKQSILKAADFIVLAKDRDKRLNEEELEREKEAQKREKNKKKAIKFAAIAASIILVCIIAITVNNQVIIPQKQYEAAETMLKNGQYEDAKAAFTELGDYRDSEQRITDVTEAKNEYDYQKATELFTAGKYNDAKYAFLALGEYKDSENMVAKTEEAIAEETRKKEEERVENEYKAAVVAFQSGKYEDAYQRFLPLIGYKDVDTILKSDEMVQGLIKTKGNIVLFGTYEQDNSTFNGKEPIEWVVADTGENSSTLISKNVLDYQLYNGLNWDNCSLRSWLNETFLQEAFDDSDRNKINVYQTNDKVFLLSNDEVTLLFPSEADRIAQPTPYAAGLEHRDSDNVYEETSWLLRKTGPTTEYSDCNLLVDEEGCIVISGLSDTYPCGVRPAIVIQHE